jgi:uncharacterized RDD family membrane protein YckC
MVAHSYQRIFAFVLDFFIVAVISTFLTFWIPNSKTYEDAYEAQKITISNYLDGEIKEKEYEEKMKELTYTLSKERIIFSLVDLIVSVAYFGSYTYYSNGQTFGKRAMKIKIVSNDHKELKHINMLLRAFCINGCFASSLEILFVFILSKDSYFSILSFIEIFQFIFLFSSCLMLIYKSDKRGLHDLICNTKVVKI